MASDILKDAQFYRNQLSDRANEALNLYYALQRNLSEIVADGVGWTGQSGSGLGTPAQILIPEDDEASSMLSVLDQLKRFFEGPGILTVILKGAARGNQR